MICDAATDNKVRAEFWCAGVKETSVSEQRAHRGGESSRRREQRGKQCRIMHDLVGMEVSVKSLKVLFTFIFICLFHLIFLSLAPGLLPKCYLELSTVRVTTANTQV